MEQEDRGVKKVILEETSSTQDEAFRLLEYHPRVLVMARKQLSGRGRRGHRWHSPEGGLYVSFGWRGMEPSRALLLNLIAPVSIVNLLRRFGIEGCIKLPNDVLVSRRKIAGILVEVKGDRTVLGIGINVNQKQFPPALRATSMRIETGRKYTIEDILDHLERELDNSMAMEKGQIIDLFNRYMLKGPLRFRYMGKQIRDVILKITEDFKAEGESGNYNIHWMEDVMGGDPEGMQGGL